MSERESISVPATQTNTSNESPLHTIGFDARFPQQNQTKHCWQAYVDYYKCIDIKGEDFAPCKVFWRTYSSLCPVDWIEKWNEQREKSIFTGNVNTE